MFSNIPASDSTVRKMIVNANTMNNFMNTHIMPTTLLFFTRHSAMIFLRGCIVKVTLAFIRCAFSLRDWVRWLDSFQYRARKYQKLKSISTIGYISFLYHSARRNGSLVNRRGHHADFRPVSMQTTLLIAIEQNKICFWLYNRLANNMRLLFKLISSFGNGRSITFRFMVELYVMRNSKRSSGMSRQATHTSQT